MNINPGQKLYHFAYGPLTVTDVVISNNGNTVRTVADDLAGYRFKACSPQATQMWLLDTVGHWIFESEDQVGTENNDFDWKACWPDYEHAPTEPVASAQDRENWHGYYGSK